MLKSKRYIISRSEFPDENQVELLEISTGKTTRVNKDQINKTDFVNLVTGRSDYKNRAEQEVQRSNT